MLYSRHLHISPGKEGVLCETFIIISTISSSYHDTVNPSGTFQHSHRLLQSRSQIHRKTVSRPKITLNTRKISMENGEIFFTSGTCIQRHPSCLPQQQKGCCRRGQQWRDHRLQTGYCHNLCQSSKTTVTCRVTVKKNP